MQFLSALRPQVEDENRVVARIVYASEARIRGSVYGEMERIRASAMRHNEPVGVHTALLYQSGWFIQWKEGPGAAVQKIMARVANDRRHTGLRIVHSSRGPRLLSGPWSMAIVQCDETQHEMALRVAQLRNDMEQGIEHGPPAIWRRLSTPMRHPGGRDHAVTDSFQRVMVCAAAGNTSFELVHWLARQHKEEVVHRRFAGPSSMDVGTDYVDFVDASVVMRVIAMARNGLSLPLTRAFLSDYSHLILLMSGDTERDLHLVHRVAEACHAVVSPPALVGIAADAEHHAAPFKLAHQLGLLYLDARADPEAPQDAWAAVEPLLAIWRDASNSGVIVSSPRRSGY